MPTNNQDRVFSEEMETFIETKVNGAALDSAISWIGSNLDPDDVFDEKQLSNWAESNGYIKE
jgi:hypothetical protein